MGTNPSHFKGDDLPVEQVSWDDVQDFLKALNRVTNKAYRLPTEAEWEYAARGGGSSRMTKYAGSNDPKEVAWYRENSGDKPLSGDWSLNKIKANNCRTHPVGQKKGNELGLCDMSGNVWEWCADWYDEKYYDSSLIQNPQGPSSCTHRVLRGGSWSDYPRCVRVSYRFWLLPVYRLNVAGFRVARD